MEAKKEAVKVPVFEAESEREVLEMLSDKLRKNSNVRRMKRGEILIQQGEKATSAYFVIRGSFAVQADYPSGDVYRFAQLGHGAVISDVEVLSGTYINAATLVAEQETVVLRIPLEIFEQELKTNITFLYYIASRMAGNFHSSSIRRNHFVLRKSLEKVVMYLNASYQLEYNGDIFEISKTRPEIASEIGISVRMLNRDLRVLREKKGFLTMNRGKITISPAQFRKITQFIEEEGIL